METRFEKMSAASLSATANGIDSMSEYFHSKLGYYFNPGELAGQSTELMAKYANEFGKNLVWKLPEELIAVRWQELKESKRGIKVGGKCQPQTLKPAGEVTREIIRVCVDPICMAYAQNLFDFGHFYQCLLKIEGLVPDEEAIQKVRKHIANCI